MALHERRNYYICSPNSTGALWLEYRIHVRQLADGSSRIVLEYIFEDNGGVAQLVRAQDS